MASRIQSWFGKGASEGATSEPEKNVVETQDAEVAGILGPDVDVNIDETVEAGELTFVEDTKGGMGRHLGLWSTTFLM